MQPTGPEISTCPDCGRPLEKTYGHGLRCTACLLRAGISGEDERSQDSISAAFEGYEYVGCYKIDRREDGSPYELGRGAMGTTYRAFDTTLHRKVALKVIRSAVAGRSKQTRESFLREARTAAALRHEHIATVFQFGIHEETGRCFYAMELVEGETLEERVRRGGPLDLHTTIDIAQQVTAVLGASEKHGLVHCDLKPANLMLVDLGGCKSIARGGRHSRNRKAHPAAAPIVKIIDFGLAKAVHPPLDRIRVTQYGFVGTPAFASPEQFENSAPNLRSDIYSLGVTLWFALTGKTPFAGYTCEEIHRAQRFNALPIEQLKSAGVPSRLRSVLRSMLAFEAAQRPSVQELAAELRACAAQATGARRARVFLAAASTAIAFASGFFVFHSLRPHSAPPASDLNLALLEKGIALVQFEKLSVEQNSAFLAHEVHDDILMMVGKIVDLRLGPNATLPGPFVQIDQTVIHTIEQNHRARKIVKVRHQHKRVVRVRTLWNKLVYGWVVKRPDFVKKKSSSESVHHPRR
jgi:serine/threonine protein kinase